MESKCKTDPPFEKYSLSTFCPMSYVSFARPCKYDAASVSGSSVEASGLNSHTVQPEACVDRDPMVQGWVKEKAPRYLGGSEKKKGPQFFDTSPNEKQSLSPPLESCDCVE